MPLRTRPRFSWSTIFLLVAVWLFMTLGAVGCRIVELREGVSLSRGGARHARGKLPWDEVWEALPAEAAWIVALLTAIYLFAIWRGRHELQQGREDRIA